MELVRVVILLGAGVLLLPGLTGGGTAGDGSFSLGIGGSEGDADGGGGDGGSGD